MKRMDFIKSIYLGKHFFLWKGMDAMPGIAPFCSNPFESMSSQDQLNPRTDS